MGSISSERRSDIIYRSKLPDIDIPNHLPLHTYCFQNLPSHGDRPFLIDGATGATLTHADVHLTARKVATGLRRLGVRKNHVIMLLLPNSPEFVISFLAASFLGAASTTANPFYTAAEIHNQAKLAGATLIITKSSHVDKLQQLVNDLGVKIVCTDEALEGCVEFSELSSSEKLELEHDFDPTDVVALPFSSGTTGLPKGVMLTHRGLVTSVAQQVDGDNPNIYLRSDDVILCVLPLFHIYSLVSIMLCGLRVGAAVVIVPKFDVVGVMRLVERYGVTVAPFVPPIVVAIAKSPVVDEYDMSSVRMVVCGAAPLGKELEDAVKAKLPNATLGQGYGMTEAGAALSMCLAFAKEPFEVKSAACGTVVRNAELRIVDIETGVSLPTNQPGEIQIKSQAIMKGYINDPEATSQTVDKDGWLHTGDIGYVDDDDEIFIVDRLKEIIKYKGYQVAPAEIEALLIAHPYIVEAAVVPMKDELAGELPVAFVIRSDGSNITDYEIKKYVSEKVVFYKRIHRVFFVDSILKAPSGKILRKHLKAKLAAGLFD